jgi:hypothetical protein
MGPHEDRWCQRCGRKNETLYDVCRCGWHCGNDRKATEGEIRVVRVKLDAAIEEMKKSLGK